MLEDWHITCYWSLLTVEWCRRSTVGFLNKVWSGTVFSTSCPETPWEWSSNITMNQEFKPRTWTKLNCLSRTGKASKLFSCSSWSYRIPNTSPQNINGTCRISDSTISFLCPFILYFISAMELTFIIDCIYLDKLVYTCHLRVSHFSTKYYFNTLNGLIVLFCYCSSCISS